VLALLTSCRQKSRTEDKQVFRINFSSGVLETTDPAFAKNLYIMWTVHMMYNTLVETDENLNIVPSLAKSWQISEDGLRYTFIIRDSVYFHDNEIFPGGKGRKMTAADVAYSFNRIIEPGTASSGAWIFNDRVADKNPFTAINDSTFEIRLKAPFKPLIEILTMPYCSVVPHEGVSKWGKDFRSHPCGTGPFVFHHWDEAERLILHKNNKYWQRDNTATQLPYIDGVEISFVDSKATEFFLFMQGKLHFVNGIAGSFKDLVLTKNGELKQEFRNKFNVKKSSYLNTEYLGFVVDTTLPIMNNSPLRNVLVRRAINYAIDREKIVTYFRNGVGIPATSGFIPAGMPGYDTSHSYGYTYDTDKALALLAQAGYPNGKGLPTLTAATPDIWADIVNFIANQLQAIGIKMQVEIMQRDILRQSMVKSEAQMFRGQWIADYPNAETYLAFFYGKFPAPPNYTRYKSKQYDQWYDESMAATDEIRRELYRKMDSLVTTDAALIPLFYDQQLHFTQKNVEGFRSTPMNLIDIKEVRLNPM
jgi:peptide/nickel transport system substrate-binding protein